MGTFKSIRHLPQGKYYLHCPWTMSIPMQRNDEEMTPHLRHIYNYIKGWRRCQAISSRLFINSFSHPPTLELYLGAMPPNPLSETFMGGWVGKIKLLNNLKFDQVELGSAANTGFEAHFIGPNAPSGHFAKPGNVREIESARNRIRYHRPL